MGGGQGVPEGRERTGAAGHRRPSAYDGARIGVMAASSFPRIGAYSRSRGRDVLATVASQRLAVREAAGVQEMKRLLAIMQEIRGQAFVSEDASGLPLRARRPAAGMPHRRCQPALPACNIQRHKGTNTLNSPSYTGSILSRSGMGSRVSRILHHGAHGDRGSVFRKWL